MTFSLQVDADIAEEITIHMSVIYDGVNTYSITPYLPIVAIFLVNAKLAYIEINSSFINSDIDSIQISKNVNDTFIVHDIKLIDINEIASSYDVAQDKYYLALNQSFGKIKRLVLSILPNDPKNTTIFIQKWQDNSSEATPSNSM